MTSAYWQQFTSEEINEMHGSLTLHYEKEEFEIDPEELYNYLACDCGNCMSCLGLSWSDFL